MLKHTTSYIYNNWQRARHYQGQHKKIRYNWRASVASETLTGVTESKIGDVCLLASERSERDTYRGNTIENRGCLFIYLDICLDVCMSFCTLTLRIFVFARRSTNPVPNLH